MNDLESFETLCWAKAHGRLSPEQSAHFETALETLPGARELAAEVAKTDHLLREAGRVDPAQTDDDLIDRILQDMGTADARPVLQLHRRLPRLVYIAAAVAALLMLLFFIKPSNEPSATYHGLAFKGAVPEAGSEDRRMNPEILAYSERFHQAIREHKADLTCAYFELRDGKVRVEATQDADRVDWIIRPTDDDDEFNRQVEGLLEELNMPAARNDSASPHVPL